MGSNQRQFLPGLVNSFRERTSIVEESAEFTALATMRLMSPSAPTNRVKQAPPSCWGRGEGELDTNVDEPCRVVGSAENPLQLAGYLMRLFVMARYDSQHGGHNYERPPRVSSPSRMPAQLPCAKALDSAVLSSASSSVASQRCSIFSAVSRAAAEATLVLSSPFKLPSETTLASEERVDDSSPPWR